MKPFTEPARRADLYGTKPLYHSGCTVGNGFIVRASNDDGPLFECADCGWKCSEFYTSTCDDNVIGYFFLVATDPPKVLVWDVDDFGRRYTREVYYRLDDTRERVKF